MPTLREMVIHTDHAGFVVRRGQCRIQVLCDKNVIWSYTHMCCTHLARAMNHTSHPPFGTSGGGPGHLKWSDANDRFMTLNMATGKVLTFRGNWPPEERIARYRLADSREWRPLVVPEPLGCNAQQGATLLRLNEFAGVEDCYLLLHLPNKVMRVLRRVDDNASGAVEQFDGYWYATERDCELLVLE